MPKYPLTIMPVVSVAHGQAQLAPSAGEVAEPTFGTPAEAIASWTAQQAAWVHVVDQDAEAGQGDNHLALALARGANLQVAAGVQDDATLEVALETGCARVIIEGHDVDWAASVFARCGERVAVHLDVRARDVWRTLTDLEDAGAPRYLAEDTVAHGLWHKGDKHLLAEVCQRTDRPVMSLGGVHHLEDLHRLHELVPMGLDTIVIGAPLYEGAFSFGEAMAASADRFDLYQWSVPGQ